MNPEQKVYALVLGRVVSTLRSRVGLTQAGLASEVRVAQATISRIERGALIPDAQVTERIADALGISVAELYDHVNDGVSRTQEAAEGALGGGGRDSGSPWWVHALKIAGVAGLTGLAIFAVAAALSSDEDE